MYITCMSTFSERAENDVPRLAVVLAPVFETEGLAACEHRQDVLEGNAMLVQVPAVLGLVPLEHAVK
jgi:hypothetical protein